MGRSIQAASGRKPLPTDAREAMERLNQEAAPLAIWLRTQANAPAQQPWFRESAVGDRGQLAHGRVAAGQQKAQPHHWRWSEISPYLDRIAEVARNADVSPVEFADRQQFLLTNPGFGGRLQVANTIRCAVSIYNPGDVAPVHVHTPNASRLILSPQGGYTTVDGERCEAERGDLILTPNGTWHDHGNDGGEPVVWMDVLDWPLLEALDCIWLDDDYPGELLGTGRGQKPTRPHGYSDALYGGGGIVPNFVDHQRGFGHDTSPLIQYRGRAIRAALERLRAHDPDPYEGISLKFVDPVTGHPLFPTLEYTAQLLTPGSQTRFKRETSSIVYTVVEGRGSAVVGDQTFDWDVNDIFVVPNFLWRRHINRGRNDAVLYAVSDRPLLEKIGQYRAQGKRADETTEQIQL